MAACLLLLCGCAPETNHRAAARHGALPAGPAADCVAEYSPTTLQRRAFAFDGVIAAIGPARTNRETGVLPLVAATFTVREWFRGGSAPTVTVDLDPPDLVSEDGPPAYEIGSRLLVSGEPRWGGAPLDDAIAWACGFTRYYDSGTAKAWEQAFR